MKTSELTGPALDWAVAKCEEYPMGIWYDEDSLPMVRDDEVPEWKPSTDWAQGGLIIERERINLEPFTDINGEQWSADGAWDSPTPLIAAMRCFVASKLGDEVEVPDELLA